MFNARPFDSLLASQYNSKDSGRYSKPSSQEYMEKYHALENKYEELQQQNDKMAREI